MQFLILSSDFLMDRTVDSLAFQSVKRSKLFIFTLLSIPLFSASELLFVSFYLTRTNGNKAEETRIIQSKLLLRMTD